MMNEIQGLLILLQIANLAGVGGIIKYFLRMNERISKIEGYCQGRNKVNEKCGGL